MTDPAEKYAFWKCAKHKNYSPKFHLSKLTEYHAMTEPKASLRERTEEAATDAWIGDNDDYDELIQRCEPEDIEGFMTIALHGPPIEFLIETLIEIMKKDVKIVDQEAYTGPIFKIASEALSEIRKARGEK